MYYFGIFEKLVLYSANSSVMMTSRKKCLTFDLKIDIIQIMSKEISTRISPEGLEIANAYLQLGSVQLVSSHLNIDEAEVSEF